VILDELHRFVGRQINVTRHESKYTSRLTGQEVVDVSFDVTRDDEVMNEIERLADEADMSVMPRLPGWWTTAEINDNRLNVFFTRTENDEFFIERFSIG
jgi:hypothetical protein